MKLLVRTITILIFVLAIMKLFATPDNEAKIHYQSDIGETNDY